MATGLQAQPPEKQPDTQIPTTLPTDPNSQPSTLPATNTFPTSPTQPGRDRNEDIKKTTEVVKKDTISSGDSEKKAVENKPLGIYGANVFSGAARTDVTELSTPPLDYPIGVGDQIIVSLYGGAEYQQSYDVGNDGSIFPEGMGKIYVGGYTFENMRNIVHGAFAKVVPAGTSIDVTMGHPRSINVNVVNEVNKPGIYTVSAFSNAFNVIDAAGGITNNGNLRKIIIKRAGKVIDELDVYKYLNTGDFGKHIYLQNNDFIIVPFYDKKVLATGQFKRPMYYQLKKNEGLKELTFYAGGFTPEALSSAVKIMRTENETQNIKTINALTIAKGYENNIILEDGDVIKVDVIKSGLVNKVLIRGAVKYPDIYEVKKGEKLFDILNKAGGVTSETYLDKAYILRSTGDSTVSFANKLQIDLNDYNQNNNSSVSNVVLEPNDLIHLFYKKDFSDPVYVEIFGEIRKPGKYDKFAVMTLQDLLYFAGGIRPSAEFGRLEISSVVDVDSAKQGLKPTRTVVKSFQIAPDISVDSLTSKIILKPYDQIYVRKNPTFELQKNIELIGMLKYPGFYPKLAARETISSFIKRAGGFKDNANLAGAILIRKKMEGTYANNALPNASKNGNVESFVNEPIAIDLYNAMKYPNSKYDITLQEHDMIFVPERTPFVSISGNVQSPLKLNFDRSHTDVMWYIDKAGGFGIRPWRKRVYVTYADGKSKRTRNFIFFHIYPEVQEGSTVHVPVRPPSQEIADAAKGVLTAAIPIILTTLLIKYIN